MTNRVTIRGVTYPSQIAAADALGVTRQTITGAVKRGTLDFVGLGPPKPGCKPAYVHPTTVGGVTYPSRKAAAEALGVTQVYISGYIAVTRALLEKEEARRND
jgi:hypothetical protein